MKSGFTLESFEQMCGNFARESGEEFISFEDNGDLYARFTDGTEIKAGMDSFKIAVFWNNRQHFATKNMEGIA